MPIKSAGSSKSEHSVEKRTGKRILFPRRRRGKAWSGRPPYRIPYRVGWALEANAFRKKKMRIEPLPWPGYNTNARAKWIHALPLCGLAQEMSGFWTTAGLKIELRCGERCSGRPLCICMRQDQCDARHYSSTLSECCSSELASNSAHLCAARHVLFEFSVHYAL